MIASRQNHRLGIPLRTSYRGNGGWMWFIQTYHTTFYFGSPRSANAYSGRVKLKVITAGRVKFK